jgi:hypothetical protein
VEQTVINGEKKESLSSPFTIKTYTGIAVREVWGEVRGFILQALAFSRGELDIQTIWKACQQEHIQLWVISQEGRPVCVMLTELCLYARKKSCNIVAVAGRQTQIIWKAFLPFLRTWIIANEIDEIQATCRPSVARLISTLGFQETARVMTISCKEWTP